MTKERDIQIAFMQVLGILLVVLGHCHYAPNGNEMFFRVVQWIYTFHMPLFFFASGYLLCVTRFEKDDWRARGLSSASDYMAFIHGKARRLLLPYFLLGSVVYVPKALLSRFAIRPVDFSLKNFIESIVFPYENAVGSLWFLPTLFIIFLLAVSLRPLLERKGSLCTLLVVTVVVGEIVGTRNRSLFNWMDSLGFMQYFVMGFAARRFNILRGALSKHATLTVLLPLTASVALFVGGAEFPFVDAVAALLGIAFIAGLAILYERHSLHWADHLFDTTYTIYLFSWFPQVAVLVAGAHFGIPWYIATVIAFLAGVYIPFAIAKRL